MSPANAASRPFVLIDAGEDEDHVAREIASASARGSQVIAIVDASSELGPVIEGIRRGVVVGAVSRPLQHAAILPIVQRTDPQAAFDDLDRILGDPSPARVIPRRSPAAATRRSEAP